VTISTFDGRASESAVPDVTAVVLAGGRGDRIGPIGQLLPKAILPVSPSQTLLSRTLEHLREARIPRVVVSTSPDQYSILAAFVERCVAISGEEGRHDRTTIEVVCNPLHESGSVAAFGEMLTRLTAGKAIMYLGDIWCSENPFTGLLAVSKSGSAIATVPATQAEARVRGGAVYLREGRVLRLYERVGAAEFSPETEVHQWIGAALLDAAVWADVIEFARSAVGARVCPTEEDMLNHLIDTGCRLVVSIANEFVNVNKVEDWERILRVSTDRTGRDKRAVASMGEPNTL
jgi:NDP-sugar pyrophosphorylase family protein